jgi:hypothetical protein
MTSVIVAVPWRPQPSRIDAFDRLLSWYAEHLPDLEVTTVDSGDVPFNLARCRNLAVRSAGAGDVVVLNDADTLPEGEPLLRAIDGASSGDAVHLPYDEYRWLGAAGSAQLAAGTPAVDCGFELVRGACSGVAVTSPGAWFAHGGQDERFEGWGFEDKAWVLAHTTMLGRAPVRWAGRVYALHHVPAVRAGAHYDANEALLRRYEAASGDRDAMAHLVAEAGLAEASAAR